MAKVSQRQILAQVTPSSTSAGATQINGTTAVAPPAFKVGNEPFYFAQVSGGEITASVEKIYEGGKSRPTVLCAPSEIGDITLTAHYDDAETSGALAPTIRDLRGFVGTAFYDITVQTFNCGLSDKKNDRIYKNALLVGLTEPDGDSSSGAPSTFALTFSISDVSPPTAPAPGAAAATE